MISCASTFLPLHRYSNVSVVCAPGCGAIAMKLQRGRRGDCHFDLRADIAFEQIRGALIGRVFERAAIGAWHTSFVEGSVTARLDGVPCAPRALTPAHRIVAIIRAPWTPRLGGVRLAAHPGLLNRCTTGPGDSWGVAVIFCRKSAAMTLTGTLVFWLCRRSMSKA
jgi:hypothetical protein